MTTTPILLSGKSRDRGNWQATVHRVTKGQTQLNTHIHNRRAQREDDVMIHREKTLPRRRRKRLELCCQRPGATRPGREALAELISWVPCLFLVRAVTAFKPRLCQLGVALRWLYNHASLNSLTLLAPWLSPPLNCWLSPPESWMGSWCATLAPW